MPVDPALRSAIDGLFFALDEIETHWGAMESLLQAHLDLVLRQPTDPRILSGDYTREEIGDDTSYIQHEINALVKNRDLIREKRRLLFAAMSRSTEVVDPNGIYSCCPGEHTFGEFCVAPSPCLYPGWECPEWQKVCDRCRPVADGFDEAVPPFERLPKLAGGFSWSEPDKNGYVTLRYSGRECFGSQVMPFDDAGIQRTMRDHGAFLQACEHKVDEVCACECHVFPILHDRACCEICPECGQRIITTYK